MGGFLEGERGVGGSLCPESLGASGEKGKWRRNENEVEKGLGEKKKKKYFGGKMGRKARR